MIEIQANSKWMCTNVRGTIDVGDIVNVEYASERVVILHPEDDPSIIYTDVPRDFIKDFKPMEYQTPMEPHEDVVFDMMAGIREYLMNVFMSADDTVKFMDGDDCQPIEVIECLEALGYRCSTSGGNFSKGTLRYKYESSIYPDVYLRIYAFDGLVSMGVINSFKEEE